MNYIDEHNAETTVLCDIITVNDTCNTHTANFTNHSDYIQLINQSMLFYYLFVIQITISLHNRLAVVNIILMRYLQKK